MAFTQRIDIIIDFITKKTKPLGNLKQEIQQTEGAFAKAGKAASGLGNMALGSAGGVAALGTAVVGMAGKAVESFVSLARASTKFSEATGVSVEKASELIEVTHDLGGSSDSLESALGRMNKTIGATPEKFAALGIQIARTKDGSEDVYGTFLNVVDALHAIPDPAARAAMAAQIFGKGWQANARLLGLTREEIEKLTGAVTDGQRITESEAKTAEQLHEALDKLQDEAKSLGLTLGGDLAGPLTTVLGLVADLNDAFTKATGPLKGLEGVISGVAEPLSNFGKGFNTMKNARNAGEYVRGFGEAVVGSIPGLGHFYDEFVPLPKAIDETGQASADAAKQVDESGHSLNAAAEAADNKARSDKGFVQASEEAQKAAEEEAQAEQDLADAADQAAQAVGREALNIQSSSDLINAALGRLDLQDQVASLNQDVLDLAVQGKAAWDAAVKGADDAGDKMHDYNDKVQQTKRDLLLALQAISDFVPAPSVKTIIAAIDEGSYAEAANRLEILARNRTMVLSIQAKGGSGFFGMHGEAFNPTSTSSAVFGAPAAPGVTGLGAVPMSAGAPRTVINVTVPPGANADSRIVGQLQRWATRNGAMPLARGAIRRA